MLIGAVLRYPAVLEIATSHGFYAMLLAMTWKLGGWLQRFNRTINRNLQQGHFFKFPFKKVEKYPLLLGKLML